MERFDAIVAGGGIAGSTTAAALAKKGCSVLVCEAGLPNSKRLAGELLHPPGAANLEELGLLEPMVKAGAVPTYGFAVFRNADDPGTLLSYSEIPGGRPTGIALEHGVLTRTLLDCVGRVPGVTLWNGTRVLNADLDAASPVVTVRRDGQDVEVACTLVVSAEGRVSKIRERAGIACQDDSSFRMVGWKVAGARLPYPGYGHVFIGGPTPILAYQVSRNEVRVMFELGLDEGLDVPDSLMNAMPEPLRGDLAAAMTKQSRATARFCGFRPEQFTARNLAIVGDAGGCVHPLIASGMSFCTADAMRLAEAVGRPLATGYVNGALDAYEKARRQPMATRGALGPAMVEALCDPAPSMRLLRHGLFRYWGNSPRGRATSMGLLSTRESSLAVMAREYAIVCANAVTGLPAGVVRRNEILPAFAGLAKRTAGFARGAITAVR